MSEWDEFLNEVQQDSVSHPKHYADTCSLECIDVMTVTFGTDAVVWFCLCNAFKYLWRYKNKNGEEDLKKAQWYMNYTVGKTDDFRQVEIWTRLYDLLEKLT